MIEFDKSLCFLINLFILKNLLLVIFQLKTVNRTLNWLLWHCLFWDIWHIWEMLWGLCCKMEIWLTPSPFHVHIVYGLTLIDIRQARRTIDTYCPSPYPKVLPPKILSYELKSTSYKKGTRKLNIAHYQAI